MFLEYENTGRREGLEVREVREDEKISFEVREVREVKEVRDDTTCGGNVTGWALNCKTIVFNF